MAVETYPLSGERCLFFRAARLVNYRHWVSLIGVSALVPTPMPSLTLASFSVAGLRTDITPSGRCFGNCIAVWTGKPTYALFIGIGIYVTGATAFRIAHIQSN